MQDTNNIHVILQSSVLPATINNYCHLVQTLPNKFICCASLCFIICILDKLHERQRDPDERVRQEVVITICDAAAENISSISDQVLQININFYNMNTCREG